MFHFNCALRDNLAHMPLDGVQSQMMMNFRDMSFPQRLGATLSGILFLGVESLQVCRHTHFKRWISSPFGNLMLACSLSVYGVILNRWQTGSRINSQRQEGKQCLDCSLTLEPAAINNSPNSVLKMSGRLALAFRMGGTALFDVPRCWAFRCSRERGIDKWSHLCTDEWPCQDQKPLWLKSNLGDAIMYCILPFIWKNKLQREVYLPERQAQIKFLHCFTHGKNATICKHQTISEANVKFPGLHR